MPRLNKVVAFGPPKEAALYFDQVFPLDLSMSWFPALGIRDDENSFIGDAERLGIPFDGRHFDENVIKSLLPSLDNAVDIYSNLLMTMSAVPLGLILAYIVPKEGIDELRSSENIESFRKIFEMGGLNFDEFLTQISDKKFEGGSLSDGMIPRIKSLVKKAGFIGSPGWFTITPSSEIQNGAWGAKSETAYALAIQDLDLIDPRKISWESLVEFRNDEESRNSLRRFRSFFVENFEGKDRDYISDKLSVLLHDYEKTSKIWGFQTAKSTLSVAASAQNVAGTAIATLAPAVAGTPLAIAAATGAAITIANCVFRFSDVFVDKREKALGNSLNYLSKIKSLS